MKALTERQKETLDFIASFTKENGFSPTIREISDYLKISIRATQDHIAACQNKGYLSQSNKKSRSLRVIKKDEKKEVFPLTKKIPLIETIALEKPLLCKENITGYATITDTFINPDKKYFAIRVSGESMINSGILDGDLAIIEQTEKVENNQIVATVSDNNIKLKIFSRDDGQAENPSYKSNYTTESQIVGKIAGLIRTY